MEKIHLKAKKKIFMNIEYVDVCMNILIGPLLTKNLLDLLHLFLSLHEFYISNFILEKDVLN